MMEFFKLLGSSSVIEPVMLSIKILIVILPMLALFGIPIGVFLGRRTGYGAVIADFLVSIPLIFPPIATGFILLVLLGRQSLIGGFLHKVSGLDMVFSFAGVAFAGFVSGLPLLVKTVQSAVRNDLNGYIEASYMLGKSELETFFRVVIPLLRKGIITGMFIGAARALGDVGITLMLGGNITGRTNTISLEIYNSVFTGEFNRAFVLAAILGGISLIVTKITRTSMTAADV